MKLDGFRFAHRLRVRWAEVDMQKIVFNGHYLMYLDTAIADYWRQMALPYEEAMIRLGGDLFVRKSGLEYLAPAEYDDLLTIGLRCDRVGNSSITFDACVFRNEVPLVKGTLVYVYADPAARKSLPVPDALRETFQAFEDGQPMTVVRTGSWAELGADALALRTRVFVDEQRVPLDMERDEADESALHAVAFNRLGQAVATGRLIQGQSTSEPSRIGRMAVTRALRGTGLGSATLEALTESARQRGDEALELHAQRTAESFYRRRGFESIGAYFEEAGLQHVTMHKSLRTG